MRKVILTAAILSGLSFQAMAETPSFNFVEVGFTQLDIDNSPFEPDGFELDFNYELSDNVYLSADHAKVDEANVDMKMTNLGIGFKSDINNSSTVFAQIDWANYEAANYDEKGYKLSAGIRSNVTENIELTGAYEYLDIDDESANYYVVGAAYKFSDALSLYADYKLESDVDQMSLGVRFNF